MYSKLTDFINSLGDISIERKKVLDGLISYINQKRNDRENINLNFICTHNSRRSHMSQIWAQVAASYCNVDNIYCYSGGTEATAMFITVKETLTEQGFNINKLSESKNPIYAIKFDETKPPIVAFSKKFDHDFNPNSNFAAIMTCDHADNNCPIVVGAEKRFAVKYRDPKEYDGTELQKAKYYERSKQIAEEMFYIFRNVKVINV